jgi:hypothetical protein
MFQLLLICLCQTRVNKLTSGVTHLERARSCLASLVEHGKRRDISSLLSEIIAWNVFRNPRLNSQLASVIERKPGERILNKCFFVCHYRNVHTIISFIIWRKSDQVKYHPTSSIEIRTHYQLGRDMVSEVSLDLSSTLAASPSPASSLPLLELPPSSLAELALNNPEWSPEKGLPWL